MCEFLMLTVTYPPLPVHPQARFSPSLQWGMVDLAEVLLLVLLELFLRFVPFLGGGGTVECGYWRRT